MRVYPTDPGGTACHMLDRAKRAARVVCRRRAAAVPADSWALWGRRMAERLLAAPRWQAAESVFCFVSLPREPDTGPLLRAALAQGKRLCVPRVLSAEAMEAVAVSDLDLLSPGALGILEPPPALTETVPFSSLDLALLPCLAADESGMRLGRGGGYYDRFLAQFTGCAVVLCPEAMLWPEPLPAGALDRRADFVLTESRLFPAGR